MENNFNQNTPLTFAEKCKAMDDKKWKKLNRLFGGLLGLAGGLALCCTPNTATFGDYTVVVVALMLLLVPRAVENQAQRDIGQGRLYMILFFALVIAVYFGVNHFGLV